MCVRVRNLIVYRYRSTRVLLLTAVISLLSRLGAACCAVDRWCHVCEFAASPPCVRVGSRIVACDGLCLRNGQLIRDNAVLLPANPDVRAEGIDLDAVVVTLLHHAFELEELLPRLRTHRFSGPVCPDRVNRQRARVWG